MDLESYQVTEASSDALREIYDGLSALPTMILSDMIMPSTRRNKEDDEIILIPERSAQYIFEGKQFAFAAITSVHGDDALVVDGGATTTRTCMRIYIYIYACIYRYILMHTYKYMQYMRKHSHTYIYTSIHT